VGLATAWFLQERGVEVTVIDREGVAAGSSWGNAGWLTPGITTPLPEPAVLKYGLRAVLSPNSPVYVPPSANPSFLKFVAGFTRHSTAGHWRQSMGKLVPINGLALESFDLLKAGGVRAETVETSSFLAAYRTADERRTLLEEIEHIHAAGQDIEFDVLTGDEARAILHWWRIQRPADQAQHDKWMIELYSGKNRMKTKPVEGQPKLQELVFDPLSQDDAAKQDAMWALDQKIHADEQAFLHRLIDIRPGMWT